MNALLVLFFVTFIINDWFFKDGGFLKIYLSFFVLYFIIYLFTKKDKIHSTYKHLMLAIFSQSYDPTVYAKLEYNVDNAKKYIEEYQKKMGIKITWTQFVMKAFAIALKKVPDFNLAIKCGKLVRRNSIDFSCLVNINNKDLAKKTLRNVDAKSMKELYEELNAGAKTIRTGSDEDHKKMTKTLSGMPS
jgi:hypothetical protein